jgi:hypothetical protein
MPRAAQNWLFHFGGDVPNGAVAVRQTSETGADLVAPDVMSTSFRKTDLHGHGGQLERIHD